MKYSYKMKIIAIKDDKSGGYTAYFDEFPNVAIQADELSEIKTGLSDVFYDIIHGSEIDEHEIDI